MDLGVLREFGRAAERLEPFRVAVGGFIDPGRESAPTDIPGIGDHSHEQREREESRSATGAWQRPQAEAAASGEAPHAVRSLTVTGVTAEEVEELSDYYLDCKVVDSSSRFATYSMSVGLFRELPFRARLYLEVPRLPFDTRTRPFLPFRYPGPILGVPDEFRGVPLVPVIRAAAFWVGGIGHGTQIISHHRYPDWTICACMTHQWIRGVDRLLDYAGMCVGWIAKALHDREIGFYPGLQHLPEWIRLERDRPNEHCGCGSQRRYGECCRPADLKLSVPSLARQREQTTIEYMRQLAWQFRPTSIRRC